MRSLLIGTVAGAAGTVALDAATYGDMVLRGRAASTAPPALVKALAGSLHSDALAADDETAANRRSGAGALLGYATGIGVGALFGVLPSAVRRAPLPLAALTIGATAMAAAIVPYASSGVSDPRTWSANDWITDAVPHVLYGFVVAATLAAFTSE